MLFRCLPLLLCIAAASYAFVRDDPERSHHRKSLNRNDESSEEEFHASLELHKHWHQFKSDHGKSYSKKEERRRRQIFADNLKEIREHNELFKQGKTTYSKGLTQYADMTDDEFREQVRCIPSIGSASFHKGDCSKPLTKKFLGDEPAPLTLDWRSRGAVTPIRNQGSCGSCWTYAAVASLESQLLIKHGKTVDLSEQNLVDCAKPPLYQSSGCNGGMPDVAFEYVKNNGLDTEESYPYEAVDGVCRDNPTESAVNVTDHMVLPGWSEETLKNVVAAIGPLPVAIDADGFKLYKSGIYDGECSNTINHGVTVVGYGTSSPGRDYWIIKNSWGTQWGMDGYALLARNKNNKCAIGMYAAIPDVA